MINLKSIETLVIGSKIENEGYVSISVDNRKLDKNTLFVAIVGEKYNPLEHLDQIEQSGCQYVVYESNSASDILVKSYAQKISFFPVKNIQETIAKLGETVAREFRQRGGKIIAISGSNGKTTTKEMLYHLIAMSFGEEKVICTQKNYNNHLGVPFTLFQINSETRFAIVELGSNAPGEIEFLCQMIHANIGVTTNIGDTHLEFFGTRKAVFEEEGVLANYCSEIFLVNADDEYMSSIQMDAKKISFGKAGVNYRFRFSNDSVAVNDYQIMNKEITGEHNFQNLAVAFSIAHFLNPDMSKNYISAAQTFKPTPNRSQWLTLSDTHVFLDAYNANPSSMLVSLNGFCSFLEKHGAKNSDACVILGDMNELGENSDSLHEEVGNFVLDKEFATTLFVGRFADNYSRNEVKNVYKFATTEEARDFIKDRLNTYKYLFIKGSRSLQLERITDIK